MRRAHNGDKETSNRGKQIKRIDLVKELKVSCSTK